MPLAFSTPKGDSKTMTKEFIRTLDSQGRISLPKELRQALCLDYGDSVSFAYFDGTVTMHLKEKCPSPECYVCKSPEREIRVGGKDICPSCLEKAIELIA